MTLIALKKNAPPLHEYRITVDGFSIGKISLPTMSQSERDAVRSEIAEEHSVPRHYIRLVPVIRHGGWKP